MYFKRVTPESAHNVFNCAINSQSFCPLYTFPTG